MRVLMSGAAAGVTTVERDGDLKGSREPTNWPTAFMPVQESGEGMPVQGCRCKDALSGLLVRRC